MFTVYKRDIADVEPFEYWACTAPKMGMAAVLGNDTLTAATASTKPTHIVMGPARKDGLVPAIRVQPTTVFQTTSTAAVNTVGGTVQLHTDGLQVTATSDGPFTVEYTEKAANGIVRGRFL